MPLSKDLFPVYHVDTIQFSQETGELVIQV